MIVKKVSKMGDKFRLIYLTHTELEVGDMVSLKPKSSKYVLYVKIAKMGDYKVAIIPKLHWAKFPHRGEVYIRRHEG